LKVLGISTPAKYVSIAILDLAVENGLLRKTMTAEFSSANLRSEDLAQLAKEVFDRSGTDMNGIDLIAVAQGPGSYSGLRGGLSAAKSFSQVLNIPIVGVSTLEAMAYEAVNVEGTVAVVLDAVKDEYNFALFTACGSKISRASDDSVLSTKQLKDLLDKFSGAVYVVSPFDGIWDISKNEKTIPIKAFASASGVACAGYLGYLSGQKDDPIKMVPNYSHMPNVKEYKK